MSRVSLCAAHRCFGTLILVDLLIQTAKIKKEGLLLVTLKGEHNSPHYDMKTYNNLYEAICDFDNIHLAYLKARRNKRYRVDVLQFSCNLEHNLNNIQSELLSRQYKTGTYRMFYVYEPKKRMILSLPFKDRVVQHAICNVIEPIFDKRFIYDSYACRADKGIHKGSSRLTQFLRRARNKWDRVYCLKCDIKQYFPSINHNILSDILGRTITCRDTLTLLDGIIRSHNALEGESIPIGNLTSQLFANVYLNELDYYMKQHLKIKLYIRYVDDFIVLDDDKKALRDLKDNVEAFLKRKLRLALNRKSGIAPVDRGVDFLGYRTWADYKLIRKRSIRNIRRGITKLTKDGKTPAEIQRAMSSWLGYCTHADMWGLRGKIMGEMGGHTNGEL